jgi:hypothetical protein
MKNHTAKPIEKAKSEKLMISQGSFLIVFFIALIIKTSSYLYKAYRQKTKNLEQKKSPKRFALGLMDHRLCTCF